MIVYLSGPMSGQPEFGYPVFRVYAKRLREAGHEVIDPSENFGGDPSHERHEYMRLDVGHVLNAEAIALLPGWERSRGARLEVAIARELNLPVLDADTLLPVLSGDARFHALLFEMGALHDKKQADYGREAAVGRAPDPFANVRASSAWGIAPWVGALMRLNDKVVRLQSFARKGSLANESAEDSMLDIAVYALIALVLYREQAEQPQLVAALVAA